MLRALKVGPLRGKGLARPIGEIMRLKALTVACATTLLLATSGCVTTEKVAVNQIGDEGLTCGDIKTQSARLEDVSDKARTNKGVNTANVAAVLFFWPAAVGNYMDADNAEKLIEKRRNRLAELYRGKRCAT